MNLNHTFTRKEIHEAQHLFEAAIKKYFGEVWSLKSDAEYRGCDWWCSSPLVFDGGIWRLCQAAKHKGATRAAGRIETKEANTILRFIIFYDFKNPEEEKRIIV